MDINTSLVIFFISDCPSFIGKLPKGPGNVCFALRSCNEISCAVLMSHANRRRMFVFDIKMDTCLRQLTITGQSSTTVIQFDNGWFLLVVCIHAYDKVFTDDN